jgi:hypothetical protein
MASSRYTPVASESHSTQPDDQEDRVLDGRSSAEVNPGTVPTEQHSHPAKDSHFTPQSVQAESTQKFPSHGIGFRAKDWWEELQPLLSVFQASSLSLLYWLYIATRPSQAGSSCSMSPSILWSRSSPHYRGQHCWFRSHHVSVS